MAKTKIKQNNCPELGGCLSELWHGYSVGYYAVINSVGPATSSETKGDSGDPWVASRNHSKGVPPRTADQGALV